MNNWPVLYPVSLNLRGRNCVVIGDRQDREAIEKHAALVEAGAAVQWLDDPQAVKEEDVASAFFVISTPQDAALSKRLRVYADRNRFLLCCIDQPDFGFVAMAAIVKSGPVRIAISTAGLAPRVGKILKEALQRSLDATFARFIDCLATQRTRVKRAHPSPDDSAIRRKAMLDAADGFGADMQLQYPRWFEDERRRALPSVETKNNGRG